ncbi:hypothetical protein LHFGNBLO_005821 [Mesorhizobium sp. AR10]|uniref:hypothetical protein n=1 Tax=Mesorhizobium sp. AR10 TaxID=2865839 RepID=UPI002160016C|nr:hypothetical protein [Mesorhizobium sp. AR10]UVK38630.1 hypothetical protein LHFGNBLO_005821 [Mesorhizobium sp. AR10]
MALAFTPCILKLDYAGGLKVELAAAHAKNSNGGKGNSGGGNSGGGNSGKGNSGKGNSDKGNNGKGSGNSTSNSGTGPGLAAGDKVTVQGNTIEVLHADGISERIEAGRFKMKDALGRTIIDRVAKAADIKRLKGL